MRRLLPGLLAILIFVTGAGILTTQLWYSARADALAGAWHAMRNMNAVLDEARHAQETARAVVDRGCSQQGQYRLGTEAALRPHLRTILILRQNVVVCSSLAGNRALLTHIPDLTERPLQLVSADETAEGEPVLISQARYAGSRILVTISDHYVRDALDVQKNVTYFLRVGEQETGGNGALGPVSAAGGHTGQVVSGLYPFAITFRPPPFFSTARLFRNGGAVLAFLLIVSGLAAFFLNRFMKKTALPEETLRLAIARG